jgi:hypothetical protein
VTGIFVSHFVYRENEIQKDHHLANVKLLLSSTASFETRFFLPFCRYSKKTLGNLAFSSRGILGYLPYGNPSWG